MFANEYGVYCEFIQMLGAAGSHFPKIKVKELPKLFHYIGLLESEEQYEKVHEAVNNDIKKIRTESANPEFELNRTYFIEILCSALYHLYVAEPRILQTDQEIASVS